jgi:protein-disulfide isomerase
VPPLRRAQSKRFRVSPLVLALGGAALIAGVLIAASVVGSREAEAEPVRAATASPAEREPLFRGIPQDGIALGRADAPVTLVEFADLQCPYCAQWARDVLPTIVDDYVRAGRVRVVFRGLAFLGPDSDKALRAVLAAGERDRFWDALHAVFARQGGENAGWVTDGLLRSLAPAGVDMDGMYSDWVEQQLAAAAAKAEEAAVPGTPYFQLGRTGGALEPLQAGTLDVAGFTAELDRLLAR